MKRGRERKDGRTDRPVLIVPMLALGLALLLTVAACAESPTGKAVTDREAVVIGASLPLSGEAASYGEGGAAGIELAVKELNDAGGIGGRRVMVIYEDDRCSAQSVTVLNRLVGVEKVDAIIGPLCSAAAGPAVAIAQQAGVPTVLFASSAPDLTKAGDYIYRVYPSDSFQGKFQAEYAYNELGKRRAALVTVQNDWGQGIRPVFKERFVALGGRVVVDEQAETESTDMRTILAKIAASDADVIIIDLYPMGGVSFVRQAKELGITLPMIGGDAYEADEFLKSGAVDGVLYSIVDSPQDDEFLARASAVSGKKANFLTFYSYDAVMTYAAAAQESREKSAVKEALSALVHEGVTGRIAFDANGDVQNAAYVVKEVRGGEGKTIG